MTDWRRVSLSEVCAKPQYGAIAKGSAAPVGPPFVRQTDIAAGRIDWSSVPYCDLPADQFDKYAIRPGDLLISRLGNGVGNAVTVRETRGAVFAGYLVRFEPDRAIADPEFIGYQLQSVEWVQHVSSFRSGAAQPTLNAQQMGEFTFVLPPLAEQQAISRTLCALDDKIESNRRVLEGTVKLATAMYLAACGEHSRSVPVGKLADFHNRRRVPLSSREREKRPGPYPYYGATGIFGYVDDFLFDETLTLVGEDGSVVNEDGSPVTQYIWGKTWINNHAHPLTGSSVSTELLFLALAVADVRPIITGAVQPKISMGNLKSLELRLPSVGNTKALAAEVAPLFAMYRHRADETRTLEALRQSLLPSLLRGSIRVRCKLEAFS